MRLVDPTGYKLRRTRGPLRFDERSRRIDYPPQSNQLAFQGADALFG